MFNKEEITALMELFPTELVDDNQKKLFRKLEIQKELMEITEKASEDIKKLREELDQAWYN